MKPLLALFVRALRQDTRSPTTYLGRAILALVMILLLFTTQMATGWGGAPGLQFFMSATYINFCFISLAGLSYFASVITEEKEEQTLGLLRMTNLNPLSILLGKSTHRLFGALLLLLAQFPFTVLAIAFGGITLNQVVAAYCTLAAYLVMLSNMALLASVIARRTARAVLLTFVLLIIYFFGPLLFTEGLSRLANYNPDAGNAVKHLLQSFLSGWEQNTPVRQLATIARTGFSGTPISAQVIINLALGCGFFGLAWLLFDRFTVEQPEPTSARRLLSRKKNQGRLLPPRRAWKRAILWKDYHFLAGGTSGTMIKLLVYIMIVAFADSRTPGRADTLERVGTLLVTLMPIALGVEVAFAANRIFQSEVRSKTLSTLGVLPMSWRRIAYEKVGAAVLGLWPGVLLFALGAACVDSTADLIDWLFHPRRWTESDASWLLVVAVAGASTLCFIHMVANLSLRIRWGALPAAFAITYFTTMLLAVFATQGTTGLVIEMLVTLGATLALHVNVGTRLRELAAAE
jgi:ABC-type transport system involved in multi-copper enzyme maturation permease subunit